MTGKHRDQLVEAIRLLAINVEDREWAGLDVVACLGLRDPDSQDVTFYIRVSDPAGRLKGSGIEGMAQLGPGEFSFHKAEVAEHLSTLLADDYINLAAELVAESTTKARQ